MSQTVKAVRIEAFGGPEVMKLVLMSRSVIPAPVRPWSATTQSASITSMFISAQGFIPIRCR